MAGFAVFMTILTYAFFGIVFATITSIALVLIARKRFPHGLRGRRAFLTTCGFAPFAGILWLVVAFLIHIQISNRLAHQDCGLSGDPYVTLPNGYVLGSLNTYSGYIVAPGFNTDVPATGPGYVRSLIDIQLTDGYFIGTFDDMAGKEYRFSLNTRDRSIQTSDTGTPINFEQVQNHVHQDPDSYWSMYEKYRHHWPRYIFVVLILTGEGALAILVRKRWAILSRQAAQSVLNNPTVQPPQSPPSSIAA